MTGPGEAYAQDLRGAINVMKRFPKEELIKYKSVLEELVNYYKIEERLFVSSSKMKLEAVEYALKDE
jgi:hypothetical protein